MTSYDQSRALSSPAAPSPATSTAIPWSRRPAATAWATTSLSSTTSTRMPPSCPIALNTPITQPPGARAVTGVKAVLSAGGYRLASSSLSRGGPRERRYQRGDPAVRPAPGGGRGGPGNRPGGVRAARPERRGQDHAAADDGHRDRPVRGDAAAARP